MKPRNDKRLLLFLSLLLLFPFSLCFSYYNSSGVVIPAITGDDPITVQINLLRAKIPRFSIYPPDTVEARFAPDSSKYWQSIALFSLLGAVFGLLAFLFLLLFPCFRSLKLFGATEPTTGLCCMGKPRVKPYPLCQVVSLKLCITILFVLVFLVCGLGIVSHIFFYFYSEEARKTIFYTNAGVGQRLFELRDSFYNLAVESNTTTDPTWMALIQSFNDNALAQEASTNQTFPIFRDIGRGNRVLLGSSIALLFICILMPCLVIVSGLTHTQSCSKYAYELTHLLLVVVWVVVAITIPVSMVTGDFCNEIDNFVMNYNQTNLLQRQTSAPTSSYDPTTIANNLFGKALESLDLLVRCAQNGTFVEGLQFTSESIDDAIDYLNLYLQNEDAPQHRQFNYTVYTMYNALQLNFVQNDPQRLQIVNETVTTIDKFFQLYTRIEELLVCKDVAQQYYVMRNSACVGALRSMDGLTIVMVCLGILETGVLWVAYLGYKRFRKKKFAKPKKKVIGGIPINLKQTVVASKHRNSFKADEYAYLPLQQ